MPALDVRGAQIAERLGREGGPTVRSCGGAVGGGQQVGVKRLAVVINRGAFEVAFALAVSQPRLGSIGEGDRCAGRRPRGWPPRGVVLQQPAQLRLCLTRRQVRRIRFAAVSGVPHGRAARGALARASHPRRSQDPRVLVVCVPPERSPAPVTALADYLQMAVRDDLLLCVHARQCNHACSPACSPRGGSQRISGNTNDTKDVQIEPIASHCRCLTSRRSLVRAQYRPVRESPAKMA
jgi:hypothetical protein